MDLHLICRTPQRLGWSDRGDGTYLSRAWSLTPERANEIVGGRIYLHDAQKDRSWHGGKVVGWHFDALMPDRIEFEYVVDGPFRVACPGGWGNEMAFVKR